MACLYRAFSAILEEDREKYKKPDLSSVRDRAATALQNDIASLAETGIYNATFEEVDGDGDESDLE